MTLRAAGRNSSLVALTALALLVLGAVAPSAFAQVSTSQIPGGDAVGTVTNTVTGGGSGDSGSGGGGGGGVTETVTNVVDNTIGTTDKVTGGVGTVVDNTTDTVKETGGTTVDQTKKTVDNTTSETGSAIHNAVGGANDLGGSVTNPLLNAKDPKASSKNTDGRVAGGQRQVGGRSDNKDNKKAAYRGESAGDRASRRSGDRGKNASLAAAEKKSAKISSIPAFAEAPQRETFMDQLAQAAGEAAQKLAFPLGLALMVGAFLMVQGRIDRKDAKLVLAPIDSEQDLLSFQ